MKRRMAQKMQFLAEDVAAAREPTTDELRGLVRAASATSSRCPSRVTFRHLYFSPDRRGERAHDDAVQALARLAGTSRRTRSARRGDPFMLQDYYGDRAPDAAREGVRARVRAGDLR